MSWCLPKVKAFPDVSLISLEDLKKFNEFLPYSKAKSKHINVNKINYHDSFIVYVSHAWLQETHPDNEKAEKYKLTIDGITKLKDEQAPGLRGCYVWIDYCCLKGNEKKKDSFPTVFYNIIMCCDCMITPIVDHLADHWQLEYTAQGYFKDYKASNWNGGKDENDKKCYLNRAWCRAEAFHCSNIPLLAVEENSKLNKYEGCLKRLAGYGDRPHFLYGHREQSLGVAPLNLAQLQNTFYSEYHPNHGNLSVESDRSIIRQICHEFEMKFNDDLEMGYKGEYDKAGHQNGLGRYLSAKFDVHIGNFVNNKKQNQGVHYSRNGDRYEGNWDDNHKCGEGVMHYINGNVYSGNWAADLYEGEGTFTYACGPFLRYEGSFVAGKKNGHGKLTYRVGETISEIEGNWSKNLTKGKCVIKYSDGSEYEGETKDSAKHGKGQYVSPLGKYKGDFKNDLYHGRGHMEYANGDIFNGEWSTGVINGRGCLVRDGEEYDGHFKDGKKCGQGKIVYKDKTVYVGEWKDDKRNGKGKWISADETEVKEANWLDDEMVD